MRQLWGLRILLRKRLHSGSFLWMIFSLVGVSGCGSTQIPQHWELGEPRKFETIELVSRRPRESMGRESKPDERDGETAFAAGILLAINQKDENHRIRFETLVEKSLLKPENEAKLRGCCVVVPGVLGKDSAGHLVEALTAEGWAVAVVWPPLVGRVIDSMRLTKGEPPHLRGIAAAREIDRTIRASAHVAQLQLLELCAAHPSLRGKPVLLIGESMGALAAVGIAATGDVPYDAALFVAGGGGFLRVAKETPLRTFLFGDLPLDDPGFIDGFNRACALDPLVAAESLRGGPIAVLTADRDEVVPTATQLELWAALGGPPRFRWNSGHIELFVRGAATVVPIVRRIASKVGPRSRAVEVLYRRRVEPLENLQEAGADGPNETPAATEDDISERPPRSVGELFDVHPMHG